jgi:hypothetical protein
VDYSPWTNSPQLQTIGAWLRQDTYFSEELANASGRGGRSAAGLRNTWQIQPEWTARTCPESSVECGTCQWSNLLRSRVRWVFLFESCFRSVAKAAYSFSNPCCVNFRVRLFSVTVRTTLSGAPDGISASTSSVTVTVEPTRPTKCAMTSSAIRLESRPTRVASSVTVPWNRWAAWPRAFSRHPSPGLAPLRRPLTSAGWVPANGA